MRIDPRRLSLSLSLSVDVDGKHVRETAVQLFARDMSLSRSGVVALNGH